MKVKYKFIMDPGHGWLSVNRKNLKTLGIENDISEFSYQKGNRVYLEEDRDVGLFLEAAKKAGWEIIIDESFSNKRSWVRYQERYKA